MAYASVEDLEARFGELPQDQRQVAATLLGDAAVYLNALVCVDPCDTNQANALMVVSCNMVHRAMQQAASSQFGVDQATATMGPFSQTAHYVNPGGGLYVSAAEKALLGADGGYIGTLPARIEGWYGTNA